MSDTVRRNKDQVDSIIENSISSYKSATATYSSYFNGESPVYITFYQINDEATKLDSTLEDTHEIVGANSSIYYNKISHVPVYGINTLEVSTQLTQRGLEDSINGDFVIVPTLNLHPREGEVFSIYDATAPDLEQHLFEITDVQMDRATSDKFYKCSYKIYPDDTDTIYSHVVKKYICNFNGLGNTDGVGDSIYITEEESALNEVKESVIDSLVQLYKDNYYNDAMDLFTYQKQLSDGTSEYYWCPYINHFLYKNSVITNSADDFLTEIYISDINESDYPGIYSEKGYRTSIFHAIETKDSGALDSITSSFFEISAYDLSMPLNLPFFSSADTYKLLDVYYPANRDFWLGAFHFMYGDEDHLYADTAKVPYIYEETALADYISTLSAADEALICAPNLLYRVANRAVPLAGPTDIYYLSEPDDSNTTTVLSGKITDTISTITTTVTDDNMIQAILYKYFSDTLTLTEDILKIIGNYYFENTMKSYILIPILIYILRNS